MALQRVLVVFSPASLPALYATIHMSGCGLDLLYGQAASSGYIADCPHVEMPPAQGR